MAFLECKNLSFRYNGEKTPALLGCDFALERGDMLLIAGETGSGKSTLLRLLQMELAPFGEKQGELLLEGRALDALSARERVTAIGYVGRDMPLTSEYVYAQLAFRLESLNEPTSKMRQKLAELCAEFDLEKLFRKRLTELSAGERQKVALAAALVAAPRLLLLDEPLAKLDPIASAELLATLERYRRRHDMTVLAAEHDIASMLPICNKMLILEQGRTIAHGETEQVCGRLYAEKLPQFDMLPTCIKAFFLSGGSGQAPRQAAELQRFLADNALIQNLPQQQYTATERACGSETVPEQELLRLDEAGFRYEKKGANILENVSLKLYPGSITALLGANGSGKSTLLRLMAGLLRQTEGQRKLHGKVCLLPQNSRDIFSLPTLRAEFERAGGDWLPLTRRFGLEKLLERHYLDLSAGELQKAALVRLLLNKPRLLLLDEPTIALDHKSKQELKSILQALADEGLGICFASHDMEFCTPAQRVLLLFDHGIACDMPSREFFAEGGFFSTQTAAACRGLLPFIAEDELLDYLKNASSSKN